MATGHTPPGASLAKRGAPLTAPPGRRPFAYWPHTPPPPPLAREADGPHREKGSHALPGLPLATYWPPTGPPGRPLTGHLRALYWPSGEASHWPKGRPRLAKGTGGGAYGHTGAPAPHFPASGRGGAFRVQRVPMRCCPCARHPFWGPLYPFPLRCFPLPYRPSDWPPMAPHWPPNFPHLRPTGPPASLPTPTGGASPTFPTSPNSPPTSPNSPNCFVKLGEAQSPLLHRLTGGLPQLPQLFLLSKGYRRKNKRRGGEEKG